MSCNETDELACNCDAPVDLAPQTTCMNPCGGSLVGEWILTDICGPKFARGNCKHPVYDSTGIPGESSLSFGTDGKVVGNLTYDGTLYSQRTSVCALRDGFGVSSVSCDLLQKDLGSAFREAYGSGLTANQCLLEGSDCNCKTEFTPAVEVSSSYLTDAKAQTVSFGGSTVQYCVQNNVLSMRANESDLTFTYRRPRISLPFQSAVLDAVQDAPIPTRGLTLGAGGCGTTVTFDTTTRTADCGADRVKGVSWGFTSKTVFFMRSLVVPANTNLIFKGDRPASIVAESIDIKGRISFEAPSAAAEAGFGTATSDRGGGGGGHCSPGGDGAVWASAVAAKGGATFGSANALSFGGFGGFTQDSTNETRASAGRGGGAVALVAAVSIDISGIIDMTGKPGAVSGPPRFYGSGGGAGGMIVLEAPKVTIAPSARLTAAGGKGGGPSGGDGSQYGVSVGKGGAGSQYELGGGGGGVGRVTIYADKMPKIDPLSLMPWEGPCATFGELTPL